MTRSGLIPFVLALAFTAAAQTPSPEVGDAVVLATNSIQVDRDTVVVSGNLVVNVASTTTILGEKDLSLDQGVITPAGFALKANSVDIDAGAVVRGAVHYNILQNAGTIAGPLVTPLSLPVITTLPQLMDGVVGTATVSVGNGQTQSIAAGNYGNLSIGHDATARLSGGTYTFASITVGHDSSILFAAAADVVVKGRMSLAAGVTIDAVAGVTTKDKLFFVHGANGSSSPQSAVSSVSIGKDSIIRATVYAPNGSIVLDQNVNVNGSLLGRDVRVGRANTLTLRSRFRNLAPVANSRDAGTNGSAPVTITLTGFDGDGDPLIFSIVAQPSNGTLSAVTSTGPTSAQVVYTPNSPNPEDAFVFRVTDSEGATGQATVSINGGRPVPPSTVTVDDLSSDVLQNEATTLFLHGTASNGAALTFSIVGSGPSHGSLSAITQPASAGDAASVVYTPAQNYTGPDSFQFQGCAGSSCDGGTYSLTVAGRSGGEPTDIAPDLEVRTPTDTPVSIELPSDTSSSQSIGKFVLRPTAAITQSAAVAGNVADANNDGFGDNHNNLPGSAPGLMSAGVGQSGGAGSNGTVRMEFEWDISGFSGLGGSLVSANVTLTTNRGTVDSADTAFHWVAVDNDGLLTDGDYEHAAELIGGVTMPVPSTQQVGEDGTFSFNVLAQLRAALKAGFTRFSIQGRVNETQQGPVRGLQVFTTASGNTGKLPLLSLATPGVSARSYRVLTLPSFGTLKDGNGAVITSVPYTLPSNVLVYQPPSFTGLTGFDYEVADGQLVNSGRVSLTIFAGGCGADPRFCNDGRN